MAGATFGTRKKLSVKGQEKWYATLCFDGSKTEKYAGYLESDAYNLGLKLCGEYNQNRSGVSVKGNVDFRKALEEFTTRDNVQDNTLESNAYIMDTFAKMNEKVKRLEDITSDLLIGWKKKLKKAGYADGTVNMQTSLIRIFLNWCVKRDYLPKNPCPDKYVHKYAKTGHYYTLEELDKLTTPIAAIKPQQAKSDVLLICAIKIAAHQGIRLSQVWGIEMKHYKPSTNRLWTKGIKGAPDKEVMCHQVTVEAIKEAAKVSGVETGRVFGNWGMPEAMGLAFRRKCAELKIVEGDFHDLKHTCVSRLEEQGFTPSEMEDITNTTRAALSHYTHASEERLRVKFEKFGYNQ